MRKHAESGEVDKARRAPRRALGEQGRAALRLVEAAPPLPGSSSRPTSSGPAAAPAPGPAAERLPIGVSALPAAAWREIVEARARAEVMRELERLRERNRELEHANRRLAAAVEAARADGERAERERTARTMGGRLPSILARR